VAEPRPLGPSWPSCRWRVAVGAAHATPRLPRRSECRSLPPTWDPVAITPTGMSTQQLPADTEALSRKASPGPGRPSVVGRRQEGLEPLDRSYDLARLSAGGGSRTGRSLNATVPRPILHDRHLLPSLSGGSPLR
jgi:hypothetical protein